MIEDSIKPVMLEVSDRGFHRRVLLACLEKARLHLARLIGRAQPALAGQRIQIKHPVGLGPIVRTVKAAVETACAQVGKQGLCRLDYRNGEPQLLKKQQRTPGEEINCVRVVPVRHNAIQDTLTKLAIRVGVWCRQLSQ